jgi:hypothetical protein
VETQRLYRKKYLEAEEALEGRGRWSLKESIAMQLDGPAARIYALAEDMMHAEGQREAHTLEMVQLAFGFEGDRAKEYIQGMERRMLASP